MGMANVVERTMDLDVERFCRCLMSGDVCAAHSVLEHVIGQGLTVREFVEAVVLPAATCVERLHRAGQLEERVYMLARHVLRAVTRRLDEIRNQSLNAVGTPQFVRFERRENTIVAHVLDTAINRHREAIITAEIRGALKSARERSGMLILECSAVRQHGLASIGVIMQVEREARQRGWQFLAVGVNSEGRSLLHQFRPMSQSLVRRPFGRRFRRHVAA